MSRPGFCEVREDFLNSTFKMAEDFKAAKETIASLERQLAEVRSERDGLAQNAANNFMKATTAEAERGRLAARCGELERALRAVRDWDALHDALPTELATTVRAALQEPQTPAAAPENSTQGD